MLFPCGNKAEQLSIYLDVADSATLPKGWARQARFSLTVHNQDPQRNVTKGSLCPAKSLLCASGARAAFLEAVLLRSAGDLRPDDSMYLGTAFF